MKTSKRHDNAIKVLVNAFFNGTLAKGTCAACAVGNLVADGLGGKIDEYLSCDIRNSGWGDLFCTSDGSQRFHRDYLKYNYVVKQIEATGFDYKDLMKIEYAFEKNTFIDRLKYSAHSQSEIMQDQYNGLVAVFKVLCEIEGVESESFIKMLDYQV